MLRLEYNLTFACCLWLPSKRVRYARRVLNEKQRVLSSERTFDDLLDHKMSHAAGSTAGSRQNGD